MQGVIILFITDILARDNSRNAKALKTENQVAAEEAADPLKHDRTMSANVDSVAQDESLIGSAKDLEEFNRILETTDKKGSELLKSQTVVKNDARIDD